MTKKEAQWLAGSMIKEGWPEVWIEPGIYSDDWRVSYRRLPDESPRHAVTLSKSIKARCEQDQVRGTVSASVEELTRDQAAARTRLRPAKPIPIFQGEPLTDGEILHETDLPCPCCEDEGRKTLAGQIPCLYRRENEDLVCPSHGELYANIGSSS